MKKAKKYIIACISILFVIGLSLFIYFTFIYDKNKLSIREKEWLSNNSKNVISFGVTPGLRDTGSAASQSGTTDPAGSSETDRD